MSTIPTRIDHDLFDAAKTAGDLTRRSAAQQIDHWARIGREIEFGSSISLAAIAAVLAKTRSYDTLSTEEQAVVRAEWAERMEALRASLDLPAHFAATGEAYVGLDDEGRPVRYAPDGTVLEVVPPRRSARR